MMRKVFVCVCVLCCLFALPALGETLTKDGVIYQIKDNQAVVTGYVTDAESITIYAEVNGLPVRYDNDSYIYYNEELQPGSVKDLIIAEGVTELYERQFYGWYTLERIVWPTTLRKIGDYAFCTCESLREVNIPEGVVTIGEAVFISCGALEKASLPSTLTKLGEYSLGSCYVLTEITVSPESETFMDIDGVLFDKGGQTLLVYPMGREGPYTIPQGTTAISPYAFNYNAKMTSLTIPEGVTALLTGTLSDAYALEWIYIPASVDYIEEYTLPTYGALKRVEVAEGNTKYKSVDGVLYQDGKIVYYPYAHGQSFDFPGTMESVPYGMFSGNSLLQSISIGRGVTGIEMDAFYGCTVLERVSLPITLESIGVSAFANCIALTSITLPPSLQTIGDSAFYNCASLREIYIPDGVQSIGENAFTECSPDFVIYAAKGSAGYWSAREQGVLWAERGGEPGYVKASQRQTLAAVVKNDSADHTLNLRASPSEGAKLLGKYPNGTTVEVLGTEGEWSHVRLGDTEGYMFSKYLMLTDRYNQLVEILWAKNRGDADNPMEITLYTAPLFDAPSERIMLEEEEYLRVTDTLGVWYQVEGENGGHAGYVLAQEVRVARNASSYYDMQSFGVITSPDAHDRLHLRKEPSRQSESLGRYFNGTQVEILETLGDWCKVRVDGQEGYMMSEFLSIIGDYKYQLALGHG